MCRPNEGVFLEIKRLKSLKSLKSLRTLETLESLIIVVELLVWPIAMLQVWIVSIIFLVVANYLLDDFLVVIATHWCRAQYHVAESDCWYYYSEDAYRGSRSISMKIVVDTGGGVECVGVNSQSVVVVEVLHQLSRLGGVSIGEDGKEISHSLVNLVGLMGLLVFQTLVYGIHGFGFHVTVARHCNASYEGDGSHYHDYDAKLAETATKEEFGRRVLLIGTFV